jgi:signal transduction histidine kinase
MLDIDDSKVSLLIVDDGVGFDVDNAQKSTELGRSMGLLSMRERAMLAGGELAITSRPGRGTSVRLSCPLAVGETLH